MKAHIVLLSNGIYSSRVLFDEENVFFNLSDVIRFLKIKKHQTASLEYSQMVGSSKYIDKHLLRFYIQQYGNSGSEKFMDWVERSILHEKKMIYTEPLQKVEKPSKKITKKQLPKVKIKRSPPIRLLRLNTRKDNDVRSRIIKVVYDSGLEIRDFCYHIEFPFRHLKRYLYDCKKTPFLFDIVVKILTKFPNIDTNWLIMGK